MPDQPAVPDQPRAGVKQATSAGLWSSLDVLFRQGAQFGVAIILARLLTPADFGVVALLTFFSGLSNIFVQGFTLGLVQRQDTSHDEESAAFWANLAASILLAAVLVAVSSRVAAFYDIPVLTPLMWATGAQVVVAALGAVHNALLTRQLRFATLTRVGIVSSAASGVLGIAAAWWGLGVWALAIQAVSAAALLTGALWIVSDWRPSLRFRFAALRRLWEFGSWLSLSTALEVLYSQGFSLVLGKAYGVVELGLFSRAANTQQLPVAVISSIISRIALPLFSARADDPLAMRRGAQLAIGTAMLITVPLMLGLAVLAPLAIELLFGPKWAASAPILSIIALGGMLLPLHVVNVQILLARGASRSFFRLEIAKKVAGVLCLGTGALFGINELAWGAVVAGVLAFWLNGIPNGRAMNYGALRQTLDLAGLVPPAAAMCAVVYLLRDAIALPLILRVALLVAAGGVTYVGTGLLLRVPLFLRARDMGLELLRVRRGKVAARAAAAPADSNIPTP